jgi:hypothetical protein
MARRWNIGYNIKLIFYILISPEYGAFSLTNSEKLTGDVEAKELSSA